MKVLQINSVCGVGSTGRIATDIHSTLKGEGHESYIAFGRKEPLSCDSPIRIGTNWDNYVHVVLTRLFDKHGFGSRDATLAFLREVERLVPDIIHLHNIHGYYMHIELLFSYLKMTKTPVIWTLHDCWAFTGHCSYFDHIGCKRWETGCFDCPQRSHYPASLFFEDSRRNFERKRTAFRGLENMVIVTPSNWLARQVERSFLNKYPIQVINNGVDTTVFRPGQSSFRKKHNLEAKYLIVGVASVWDRRKGHHIFMELSKEIGEGETIVMVGLTPKQISDLPKGVLGIPRTNSIEELAQIYSAADVFLNPTLEDNFPTTNLEALASGTPVITFDTGGSVEAIDEATGIIVERGNAKGLIEAISSIRARGGKSHYSTHCRERALTLFDKRDRYRDYLRLYRSLVS